MYIHGIHHITAISSNAKSTYDFYTSVLGLRLVKKSVNQDDVQTYHLFFGNKTGSPGMDLTFFPFAGVPPGKRGNGLVTTITFAVPSGSLSFWKKRFETLQVKHEQVTEVFGKKALMFYDNDDQRLELIETDDIHDMYQNSVWTTSEISKDHALRAFYSATLSVGSIEEIQAVLDVFGYKKTTQTGNMHYFRLEHTKRAPVLIIEEEYIQEPAINAAGTVHHIAFAVKSEQDELRVRNELVAIGLYPTPVIDRYYFKSVYFRTPAGILFEIATDEPGFTADEDEATLGEELALPPFLEPRREEIERNLPLLQLK